ncbi:hypothetical protein [Streptomyces sp. NPDC059649]|uniref:hypothetical protein n=1 Tax=Streptomyces sp. NPDC059649 TaxID=3346895 RepID=UPI003687932B
MTATDTQPISDADLLTFAVIGEHRARQHRQGISTLLFPFPPCPTCGAQVHELGVSGMPIATGQTMTLRPCLHRYRITEDAMLHIGRPAWDMLEDLERHGITGTPVDIAAEARARLGEKPANTVPDDLREPDNPAASALAQRIADHPMSTIQAAFRILGMQLAVDARPASPDRDCPACEASIPHDEHCPTPETHNWGCGCPTDEALREQYTQAISRTCPDDLNEEDARKLAEAVLVVRDRRMEQLAAGRATWKAKGEEMERDRDRLATQVDQLILRLGQYANRGIANGERAEEAEATLARVRAFVADMRDWCSPRGIAADYADEILAVIDGPQDAADRSSAGQRAGDPSTAGPGPGDASGMETGRP